MSQPKVLSFFTKKRPAPEDEDSSSNKRCRVEEPDSTSSPAKSITGTPVKHRVWKDAWLKTFPWLRQEKTDEQVRAVCIWCRDAGKKNPFASHGTTNLQNSAFVRHEKNPEHKIVLEGRKANQLKQTMPEAVDRILYAEDGDSSKSAQFRTMYYLTKNGQPLNQFNHLIELQQLNNCPDLQDKSKIYNSRPAQMDMVDAINNTIQESIDADVHSSNFIGIILDETTDISIYKKLNVYFQCLTASNEPVVHFIDCVSVLDGKAETLVNTILDLCKRMDLDTNKIISMASDGAAVMVGKKSGVGVRFRSHSPRLIQIHCVAHRLALAAGQACRDIQSFNDYQANVKAVYRFFHNSAVRYNQLRAMEDVMEDDDMRCLALQEPASFRWLSLEAAVTAILDVYPALVAALESEAASGNAEAKGLYTRVRTVNFLLTTSFLKDVLYIVGKVSKAFQRDIVSIDVVTTMVGATLESLEKFKTTSGRHLQATYDQLAADDGRYKDVKVLDRQALRMQFQTASTSYLDTLYQNMEERFDSESLGKLQELNTILNPGSLPSTAADISSHGQKELDSLSTYLGVNGDLPALVDGDRMKDDYDAFKSVLKRLSGQSLKDVCLKITTDYADIFPDFVVLAKLLLTTPITSVACERGFSSQNRLKTKGRSSMKHATVTKLIRIMEEGSALKDFNPKPSVQRFLAAKQRRK